MKLSDAMSLGRMLEPMNMMDYRTCALGVSLAALGVPMRDRTTDELIRRWPWLAEQATSKPFPMYSAFGKSWYQEISKGAILTTINDNITLDQLIEWVRRVEPTDEPKIEELLNQKENENVQIKV